MRGLKNGMVAVAVMLAASGAQAASGLLDFEGFTISYTNSGRWDAIADPSEYTDRNRNYGRDAATGREYTLASGVDYNYGGVIFGTATPFEVESRDGQGNVTLDASFAYAVTAKPGWQLSNVEVLQYESGTYLQYKGGMVTIDGDATGASVGGETHTRNATWITPGTASPSQISATWYGEHVGVTDGNELTWDLQFTSDGMGHTGYRYTYGISQRDFPDLTSLAGSFSRTLTASTTDASQLAFIDGVTGPFTLRASALRSISPVPEPDTYMLVAASLGVMGCLARRRSRRAA